MPLHALRPGDSRGISLVWHADEWLIRRVPSRAKRCGDAVIGTSDNADIVKNYQMDSIEQLKQAEVKTSSTIILNEPVKKDPSKKQPLHVPRPLAI